MASNLPKTGKIISIELRENAADIARENISKAGFEEIIEVRVGDAKEVIPKLRKEKSNST